MTDMLLAPVEDGQDLGPQDIVPCVLSALQAVQQPGNELDFIFLKGWIGIPVD
jgi:hypothetical protein